MGFWSLKKLDEDVVWRKPGGTERRVATARYGDPDAILMSAYVAESNYSMYREYKYAYETTLTTFLSAFGTKDSERIEGAADLNVTTTICFPNASEVITFLSRV